MRRSPLSSIASLVLGALLAGPAASAAEAPLADAAALPDANYRVIHDDAVLRVLAHKLDPGAREPLHQHPCTVNYALGPSTVAYSSALGSVSEVGRAFRAAWSRPPEAHGAHNVGLQPARHIAIEFKMPLPGVRGCGPTEAPPKVAPAPDHATRAAAPFYKVVLENAAVRLIESNVPPRQTTPPHALGCGVSIALTPQTVRIAEPGGAVADHEYAPSTAWWRAAGTRQVQNLGAQNAFTLVLEFKHEVAGAAGCAAPTAP